MGWFWVDDDEDVDNPESDEGKGLLEGAADKIRRIKKKNQNRMDEIMQQMPTARPKKKKKERKKT